MKLRNPRVWAEVPVASVTQVAMLQTYQFGLELKVRQGLNRPQYDWEEWDSLPEGIRHNISSNQLPAFTASIVGYIIPDPSRNVRRGMDRRHALSLLRRLWLE